MKPVGDTVSAARDIGVVPVGQSHLAMVPVVARPVRRRSILGGDWDRFAEACSGSLKSTRAHLIGWQFKNLLNYRLRLFEIYAEDSTPPRKIGQCALGFAKAGRHFFLDRLQILAPEAGLWTRAVDAVLQQAGAGAYEYGWELNLEPAREGDLGSITGVSVEAVRPLVVQAIDFSRWPTWDDYYWGMRKGARQSAQFAERDIPDLKFVTRKGWRSLLAAPALIRLKALLSARKKIPLRIAELVTSYIASTLLAPRQTITRVARGGGADLAAYYGVEFGANFYYLEAASLPHNQGASWALLISMIRRAYEQNGRGKFIMGYVDYAIHDEDLGGGLLRSRSACRVTDYPTSIVTFSYTPVAKR